VNVSGDEDRVAALHAFIAVASHELRNPIAGIVGAAETLDHGWDRLGDYDRHQLVALLVRQSRRLSRLVDELLELSRLEAGAVVVAAEPVDVAAQAYAAAEEAGVGDVVISCPSETTVMADPDHLRRILVNLLANADRHGARPVTVESEPVGPRVEVRVIDAGPGVPADFVPRLFDRFSRAAPGRGDRTSPQGAGLGLAIVEGLARLGGGEAFYRPGPGPGGGGGGSVFGVRLPAG
jgi:two-component system, OmpR family, sensor histidine kinase MtrB